MLQAEASTSLKWTWSSRSNLPWTLMPISTELEEQPELVSSALASLSSMTNRSTSSTLLLRELASTSWLGLPLPVRTSRRLRLTTSSRRSLRLYLDKRSLSRLSSLCRCSMAMLLLLLRTPSELPPRDLTDPTTTDKTQVLDRLSMETLLPGEPSEKTTTEEEETLELPEEVEAEEVAEEVVEVASTEKRAEVVSTEMKAEVASIEMSPDRTSPELR